MMTWHVNDDDDEHLSTPSPSADPRAYQTMSWRALKQCEDRPFLNALAIDVDIVYRMKLNPTQYKLILGLDWVSRMHRQSEMQLVSTSI